MNRLIIIGNGFDLAHKIKTSFKDFIADYFKKSINTFFEDEVYKDLLIEIKYKTSNRIFNPKPANVNCDNVFEKAEWLFNSKDVEFKFRSALLEKVYKKIRELNWVDLEIEFFNVLTASKHASKITNQAGAIEKINLELEFLKDKLIIYLLSQENALIKFKPSESLISCFCEKISKDEIVTTVLKEDQFPENLYFLNFNYTNTIERYVKNCSKNIPTQLNYIHGNLSHSQGSPIFGFGDEFNKKYLEFENEKNNELFKHIKSFEYLKTKNYYSLIRFTEANDFQVHIYGHSCGISDRTMLNQVFEHKNCKSIKIFYHEIGGKFNDFTEKTYEISRHFKDKGVLRKKLVPFELTREMPQPLINLNVN